jgi:NADPH-dependent 2,4-dienoyl-CoA reductase/sulfur reductase-like enzyme
MDLMSDDLGTRLVVIGGDAAGMSAASQAKKRRPAWNVVAFEKTDITSYSACGLPYFVAGDVTDVKQLIARTPDGHRENGIDLRTRTEVVEIDVVGKRVRAHDLANDNEFWESYDQLVIATGAKPVSPDVVGVDAAGVFGLHTVPDAQQIRGWINELDATQRQAVVVGAGYIGLEIAEALKAQGLTVTIVEAAAQPLPLLDDDMGERLAVALLERGYSVRPNAPLESIETDKDGIVSAVVAGGHRYEADIVVLGIGVRPRSELAVAANLPIGKHSGILTDSRQRVLGADGIWAAGDVVETLNRLTGEPNFLPLGTHANKQGFVIGCNLAGVDLEFPGALGTAVTKVDDYEIARTGLSVKQAQLAGRLVTATTMTSSTSSGYMPGSTPIVVKLVVEQGTGLLLGAQIVGGPGSAKRIDTVATAIWNEMTVHDFVWTDLGYAPPFSPTWDALLITARKAAETFGWQNQ